jgi:hypothetical protein
MLLSKAAIRHEFGSRRTLGTVPRQAIRFGPPDHGITHFSVRAQMQDKQGRLHRIRFRIHQKWRAEAAALTAASGSQPGYAAPEPGSGY